MTLLPNLTPSVRHVTMVQRTPSYIAALPGVRTGCHAVCVLSLSLQCSQVDRVAEILKSILPMDLAVWLNR